MEKIIVHANIAILPIKKLIDKSVDIGSLPINEIYNYYKKFNIEFPLKVLMYENCI